MKLRSRVVLRLAALAVAVTAPLLAVAPAPAQTDSPCNSRTVTPAGQNALRADCEALWAFYAQLEDPGQLDDAGPGQWGPDNPISSWQGVTVGSSSGRVVALRLYNNGLAGPIAPELGRLTQLTDLSLFGNQLTGPIPPQLGQLTQLTDLSLSGNQLTGPIPPELGRLTQLTTLNLSDNRLTGTIPPQLGQLTQLIFLRFSGNQLTGLIPPELGRLTQLTFLTFSGNQLTGPIPPELGQLTQLTHWYLYNNNLTGAIPPQLGQLTQLTTLNLSDNRLTGAIPPQLGQLTQLTTLNLSDNRLTGAIPPQLGQLTQLTHWYLYNNNLTGAIPPPLGQLTQLRAFDFSGNRVEGGLPHSLRQFDPYTSDPLGLIANYEIYRRATLSNETWNVWVCDKPSGGIIRDPTEMITLFNEDLNAYFLWLSNGRYRPKFEYITTIEGASLRECSSIIEARTRDSNSNNRYLIIDDTGANISFGVPSDAGSASGYGLELESMLPAIAHEMGHALGLPHSFGGLLYWYADLSFEGQVAFRGGEVYEYDNPMDIMSRSRSLGGTIAINRYAAGWIDPANVVIHPKGKSYIYELSPPGSGGLQMLVLTTSQTGVFTTLGARVTAGYDSDIPKEGVEAYRIDQLAQGQGKCASPSSDHRPSLNACWGQSRWNQPFPAAETDSTDIALTGHVRSVGDRFQAGTATVEILERVGDVFKVRVTDTGVPAFAGRFSDDDGSSHEASIDDIAARGITLGCSPTRPNRFCPDKVITRAQMMVFLARALLGEEGPPPDPETSRFRDVPGDASYLPHLEWMIDIDVVQLPWHRTFRPSEPLTRLDMAVFLARAFPHISPGTPTGAFRDVLPSDEHAAEVEAVLAAGITQGCSAEPRLYCPDAAVTRGQMASFLARALQGAP